MLSEAASLTAKNMTPPVTCVTEKIIKKVHARAFYICHNTLKTNKLLLHFTPISDNLGRLYRSDLHWRRWFLLTAFPIAKCLPFGAR